MRYSSMLTKLMKYPKQYIICTQLKVPSLNDLEVIRRIKKELINKRREIDSMKTGKRKKKAIKAYVELLNNLELGKAS